MAYAETSAPTKRQEQTLSCAKKYGKIDIKFYNERLNKKRRIEEKNKSEGYHKGLYKRAGRLAGTGGTGWDKTASEWRPRGTRRPVKRRIQSPVQVCSNVSGHLFTFFLYFCGSKA